MTDIEDALDNRFERIAAALTTGLRPRIAAPETELVAEIDLPLSTYMREKARGAGPRVFTIGRRNYILLRDWQAWLEARAATETPKDAADELYRAGTIKAKRRVAGAAGSRNDG
ncbi:hypothetical protein ACEUZ9_001354 [Paracoccus litorisediminis]|uniref:hypothetical protein n=1 Tax=Paracoccus litorisediminis TaxID=2006130 RepID=UPI003731F47A